MKQITRVIISVAVFLVAWVAFVLSIKKKYDDSNKSYDLKALVPLVGFVCFIVAWIIYWALGALIK